MSNVHILDGGMNAWVAAGPDVVRGRRRMSIERQVNPLFAAIPAAVGSGLVFAGLTDTCAMGMLLARLPYNRPASCDPAAVVRALTGKDEAGGPRNTPAVRIAAASRSADRG